MSKKKYIFKFFADYDRSGIVDFLDKMAADGWLLEKKSGVYYRFGKTDKAYFKYDITFFADARESNNYFLEESLDYFEMRSAAGWKFLTNDRKMQIFISEDPSATPLETDLLSQVEIIHHSMIISYLPQKAFFALRWLWLKLSSDIGLADVLIIVFRSMIALEVILYIKWYLKAKKMATEYNLFYESKTPKLIQYIEALCIYSAIIYLSLSLGPFAVLLWGFMAYHLMKD